MVPTSAMAGTFAMCDVPGASNVAAISLRTEFLAPDTATDPSSGPRARTTMRWAGESGTKGQYARLLVSTVVIEWPSGHGAIAGARRPRSDLLTERMEPDGSFTCATGPFDDYRRTVTELPDGSVRQQVDFRLAIPFLWWLFVVPVRRTLRRADRGAPWWAPPQVLDARASSVLAVLAIASLATGYLNTLLTQTISFATAEFGSGADAQGRSLTVVRAGIVIALVVVRFADTRGRRIVILSCGIAAPIIGALGAFAPNLGVLTLTQAISRPLALSVAITVGIVASEEMPKGSRAYAISLIALAGGLGAGLCVMVLPIADLGERAWRVIYLVPLVFVAAVPAVARHLPESRRFVAPHATDVGLRGHGRRFWLLAMSGLLLNLLVAPASGFQNRYLDEVRGFTATKIALFTVLTQTPAAIGVIVGGHLADARGRRLVGSISIGVGTACVVATFAVGGWPMWMWAVVGAVISGASVPALGVYSSELFPTGARGAANAAITTLSLVGSSIGLVVTGRWLTDDVSYGRVMGLLALGPAIVVGMIILLYPETARIELEELNPEDVRPGDANPGGPRGG